MPNFYVRDPLSDVLILLNAPDAPLGNNNSMTWDTNPPIVGAYITGDICWNIAPANGGIIGWRCFAGGSPGSWIAMGNHVAANLDYVCQQVTLQNRGRYGTTLAARSMASMCPMPATTSN